MNIILLGRTTGWGMTVNRQPFNTWIVGIVLWMALWHPCIALDAVQASPMTASAKVQAWARDMLLGRRTEVLDSIERDVRSASPDPMARKIWVDLQQQGIDLEFTYGELKDEGLKAALGPLPALEDAFYSSLRLAAFDTLARTAGSRLGPWEQLVVADRQNYAGDPVAAALAITNAMALAPADFSFADRAAEIAESRAIKAALLVRLGEHALPPNSPSTIYLQARLREEPMSLAEEADLVRNWPGYQQDHGAQFELGTNAYALERFDEARVFFQRAAELYPFLIGRHLALAKSQIRLGLLEDARKTIARGVAVLVPSLLPRASEEQIYWARALVEAGELGRAREALSLVEASAAKSPRYLRMLARLERDSGRHAEAAAALRKLGQQSDYEERLQLVQDLSQYGEGMEEALERIERAVAEQGRSSPWAASLGGAVLLKLKRNEARLTWLQRSVREFPGISYLEQAHIDALAKLGRCPEVIERAQRFFAVSGPNDEVLNHLVSCRSSLASGPKRAEVLAELRKSHPAEQVIWKASARALGTGTANRAARIALWSESASINSQAYWPVSELIDVHVAAKDFASAHAVIRDARAKPSAGVSTIRNNLDRYEALLITKQAEETGIDEPLRERGMKLLDAIEASGDSPAWCSYHRSTLLASAGLQREAGEALLKAFELWPDDWDVGFDSVTKHYSEVGIGLVMRAAYHYLDRNPFDGDRLHNLAHINVMWHSNPVEALRLLSLIKERAPTKYSDSFEGMAMGRLGAYVDDYEKRYAKQIVCDCGSSRYVDWFESAREKAQSGESNKVLAFDFERGTATLRLPSGQVLTRGWHRFGGAASLVQVGRYWIRSSLDEKGRISRVEDSGKKFVEISYDGEGRISRVKRHDGKQLDIAYGPQGKPTRMDFPGLGTLSVSYRADGQVDKVDSGDGGIRVASAISNMMSEFLSMATMDGAEDVSALPALARDRSKTNARVEAYRRAKAQSRLSASSRATFLDEALRTASSLAADAKENVFNASQAREILYELHEAVEDSKNEREVVIGARGVEVLHRLLLSERPDGLSRDDWREWSDRRAWLAGRAGGTPALREYLTRLEREPLKLLPPAQWLTASKLSSEGFWRRHSDPRLNAATAVLVRANMDIVVGTRQGLLVFRRGHWIAYAYESMARRFTSAPSSDPAAPASDVLSLAEDPATGRLWVGTARGLFAIDGDYESQPVRWVTPDDGLPDAYVRAIVAGPAGTYALTQGSLLAFDGKGAFKPLAGPRADEIATLRSGVAVDEGDRRDKERGATPAVASGRSGVWLLRGSTAMRLDASRSDDAVLVGESVLALQAERIVSFELERAGAPAKGIPLPDQQNIVKSKKIHGLSVIFTDEGDPALGVLTDSGMSIYRDGHFEHLKVPLVQKIAGVTALASTDTQAVLATTEGLFAVERKQAIQDSEGRVYDLLTDDEQGLTYVARGRMLQVVDHKRPGLGARPFDSIAATMLARDSKGRLVANDGSRIVRYERGEAEAHVLFQARHRGRDQDEYPSSTIRGILVSSDDTVWVASGASLFRWQDGMKEPEEFSTYVNPDRFPAPTSMVSRVFETVDGKVLVICSNEGHLTYRGLKLSGGVLEWNGTGFVRHALADSPRWFVTSYTAIDKKHAIVGTAGEFAEERSGVYTGVRERGSSSYIQLRKRVQAVLGTKGAKLGDDTWLFGSAGGVVAYRAGTWFYPDRLNWMLPEDFKFASKYGVRVVHTVATDKSGRIYVGNDRGLLIYDSGGGDSVSFLVANGNADSVIAGVEEGRMNEQLRILLAGLDPASPAAQLARQVVEAKKAVELLQGSSVGGTTMAPARPAGPPSANVEGLQAQRQAAAPGLQEVQAKKQQYLELLLKLKRQSPGLYDAINLEPLTISRLREKLREDQIILQYVPTGSTLFIHVLTRSGAEVVRVEGVRRDELSQRAERSWFRMAEGRVTGASPRILDEINRSNAPVLMEDLAWLYENLLRPIEGHLEGKSAVFVVAGGSLSHLPFGALIRRAGETPEYAAQRYVIGYLPSLFLFDRLSDRQRSSPRSPVVFADPDGTLAAASIEARSVVEVLKGNIPPYLGRSASLENLSRSAPDAVTLHLATHGNLDPVTPEHSYLLFAEGKRLAVADAMALPLQVSDLVVLSACETGVGGEGMEYLNLAYAFGYAGAPTIVATLWKIPDGSSADLMREFYGNLLRGQDRYAALANAQRTLIGRGGNDASPRAWAGFVPFGRP